MREKFHPNKTHVARLPIVYSFDNCTIKLYIETDQEVTPPPPLRLPHLFLSAPIAPASTHMYSRDRDSSPLEPAVPRGGPAGWGTPFNSPSSNRPPPPPPVPIQLSPAPIPFLPCFLACCSYLLLLLLLLHIYIPTLSLPSPPLLPAPHLIPQKSWEVARELASHEGEAEARRYTRRERGTGGGRIREFERSS